MEDFKNNLSPKKIIAIVLCLCMIVGMIPNTIPQAEAATYMYISQAGVDFIKAQEGFLLYPVWDYAQYSVGYGTRCPDSMLDYYSRYGISEWEAEQLLRDMIDDFEYAVNKRIVQHYGKKLTQYQFDALVSYSYNLGTAWLYKDPSQHSFLNAVLYGDGNEIYRTCSFYCYAGGEMLSGLMRRRLLEADMYVHGLYNSTQRSSLGYVIYNANGGTVSNKLHGFNADDKPKPITPTKSGMTFVGWYTSASGGTKVDVLTSANNKKTLYARWEFIETLDPGVDYVEVSMTTNGVNVRSGPGTSYSIVATANQGMNLKIVETKTAGGLLWGKFSLGWIALKYTNYDAALKAKEEAAKAHVYGNLIAQVDPKHTATELKAGMKAHYFCTHCNKYFTTEKVETTKEALTLAAPTHSYTTQYGYKGSDGHASTCSCGAHNTVVAHTPNISAPTESSAKICTVCQYVIAAKLDHVHKTQLTKVNAVTPTTCEGTGNIEYYVCKCGKWFTDSQATKEITDHNSVVVLGSHNYGSLVPQVNAVHTENELKSGMRAYYFCDKCDTYFTDAKAETTRDALIIPTPKHEYSISNSEINETGHADACECGKLDVFVEHDPNRAEATETDPIKCTVCDYIITPVLVHEHKDRLTKTDAKSATCTTNGNIEYYVCTCGRIFKDADAITELENINDTVILATHNYGTLVPKVNAVHTSTELKAGMNAYYFCDKCDTYFTEAKEATNYDALIIPMPTHNYTNKNAYKTADGHADVCECGAHNTVVAHTPNISAPTEEDDKICTVCAYVITPSLGHIHANHLTQVKAQQMTCTTDGSIEHYICSCGKYFYNANATNEITDINSITIKATHAYKTEWTYDLENHWHDCTVCKTKSDLAKHADNDADEKCDACAHPVLAAPTGSVVSSGKVRVSGSLRVRSGPGSTYSTVGYYYKNDEVEIYETKQVGSYVWGRTVKGWVSMDYIVLNDQSESETTTPTLPNKDVIYGVVKVGSALNVRSGPGAEYQVVCAVFNGDKVEITEKKLVGATYWGKIQQGWISMNYVIINENNEAHDQPSSDSNERVITASSLRVRAGAGTNYATITYVYRDTKVEILETKTGTDGEQWGRISQGWISMVYVR